MAWIQITLNSVCCAFVITCFAWSKAADISSSSSSSELTDKLYDFTEPNQDWIILVDRTQDVDLTDTIDFINKYLSHGVTIHPQYTRLAVISFSEKMTVEFDHISNAPIVDCQMFSDGGLRDQINNLKIDPDHSIGDIEEAFYEIFKIFGIGRKHRPHVKQSLWIINHGVDYKGNSLQWSTRLKALDITVYGVQVSSISGRRHHINNLCQLATNASSHYCKNYRSWMIRLNRNDVAEKKEGAGGIYEVSRNLCHHLPCGNENNQGMGCYCEGFSNMSPICMCENNYFPYDQSCRKCPSGYYKRFGNDTCVVCPRNSTEKAALDQCFQHASFSDQDVSRFDIVVYLFIGAHVALVLVLLITGLCYCRRRYRENVKMRDEIYASHFNPASKTNRSNMKEDRNHQQIKTVVKLRHEDNSQMSSSQSNMSAASRRRLLRESTTIYQRLSNLIPKSFFKKSTPLPIDPLTHPQSSMPTEFGFINENDRKGSFWSVMTDTRSKVEKRIQDRGTETQKLSTSTQALNHLLRKPHKPAKPAVPVKPEPTADAPRQTERDRGHRHVKNHQGAEEEIETDEVFYQNTNADIEQSRKSIHIYENDKRFALNHPGSWENTVMIHAQPSTSGASKGGSVQDIVKTLENGSHVPGLKPVFFATGSEAYIQNVP